MIRQRPSAIEKSRASRCCDRRGWNRRRYARTTSRHGGRAWAFSRCLGPLTFFPASRSAAGHTKGRRVGRLYRFTDGLPFHSQWLNSTPTGPVSRASSRHVVRIGVPLKGYRYRPARRPASDARRAGNERSDPFTKDDRHPRPGGRRRGSSFERGCLEGILSRIIFTQNYNV